MSGRQLPKKQGRGFTRVPASDYQTISLCLLIDYGVVREVKVAGAAIQVNPTLGHFSTATDSHRQGGRPVCGDRHAAGHGDPAIARAQGSSIPNSRDRSTEGIWRKLRNRDVERFVS